VSFLHASGLGVSLEILTLLIKNSEILCKSKAKMAPKKKQHQQQKQKQNSNNSKPNSKSQNSSSSSSSGPRLQISAENENRLRRLLLNNNNSARSDSAPVDDTLSKAQKAKKLKTVYEKLSCEGFTNDQIELALSALKVAFISLSLCLVSEKIK